MCVEGYWHDEKKAREFKRAMLDERERMLMEHLDRVRKMTEELERQEVGREVREEELATTRV